MAIEVLTPPAEPAVSLTELKTQCYVEFDDDNTYLQSLIARATSWVQWRVDKQLVTATLCQYWDDYPERGGPYGAIRLNRGPVQSVSSVKHYDTEDVLRTVASTDYWAKLKGNEPALVPKTAWPAIYCGRPEAIQATFVAGYGGAADVPEQLKHAVLLLAATWYELRVNLLVNMYAKEIPNGVEALCLAFESAM